MTDTSRDAFYEKLRDEFIARLDLDKLASMLGK
jgi:hypothetical protein